MHSFLGSTHRTIFNRDRICHRDCFDAWSQIAFGTVYDVATLIVGAGTNEITTVPSFNTLITGAVLNNAEGTRGVTAPFSVVDRAPRIQISVGFNALTTRRFSFGLINPAGGGEYLRWLYDSAVSPNWIIRHTNGGGIVTDTNTGIAAIVTDTRLEFQLSTAGAVNARIRRHGENWQGVSCAAVPALADANYFFQYELVTLAGGAATAWIDYIEWERNKD